MTNDPYNEMTDGDWAYWINHECWMAEEAICLVCGFNPQMGIQRNKALIEMQLLMCGEILQWDPKICTSILEHYNQQTTSVPMELEAFFEKRKSQTGNAFDRRMVLLWRHVGDGVARRLNEQILEMQEKGILKEYYETRKKDDDVLDRLEELVRRAGWYSAPGQIAPAQFVQWCVDKGILECLGRSLPEPLKVLLKDSNERETNPFWAMDGLKWPEVTITFIDDENIRVKARETTRTYHLASKETERLWDKRKKRPKAECHLLRAFIERNGVIPSRDLSSGRSCVSRLRKILRNLTGIEDDPIRYDKDDYRYVATWNIKPPADDVAAFGATRKDEASNITDTILSEKRYAKPTSCENPDD